MTSPTPSRFVVPVVTALGTTVVLSGVLWLQDARLAWPFGLAAATGGQAASAPSSPAPAAGSRVPVHVTAATLQALGVRVEAVGRESLTQSLQAAAIIVPDESRISHAHSRVAGWVEQLDVNTTGELVRAGQPLARIFSQELLSSQTEYLAARRSTAALGISSAVIASGRTRLGVLGMAPEEITAIEQTGEAERLVTL